MNEDLAASFGYHGKEGVLIGDVVPDGPADRSGLKPGDIVIEFNGQAVHSANQLRNLVASTKAGTKAKVKIFRDGREQVLSVEIGQLESDARLAVGDQSWRDLGITVRTITPDVARQLGIDPETKGVVVTDVEPGSVAALAGIRPDDIIVAVGDTQITDAASFREAIRQHDLAIGVRLQVMRDNVRRFVFLKVRK